MLDALVLTWCHHDLANGSRAWFKIQEIHISMRNFSNEKEAKTLHMSWLYIRLNWGRSIIVLKKFKVHIICRFSMPGYLPFTNGQNLGCLLTKMTTTSADGVKNMQNFPTTPLKYWAPRWIRLTYFLGQLLVHFVSELGSRNASKCRNLWDFAESYGISMGKLLHVLYHLLGPIGWFLWIGHYRANIESILVIIFFDIFAEVMDLGTLN